MLAVAYIRAKRQQVKSLAYCWANIDMAKSVTIEGATEVLAQAKCAEDHWPPLVTNDGPPVVFRESANQSCRDGPR